MTNPQFNPPKIVKHARDWLRLNEPLFFDGARENLQRFLRGEELEYGLVDVSASLHDLAIWYETSFIVEANDGLPSAAQSLTRSFDCNLWEALVIDKYWERFTEVPFGKGVDDYALYFAKGIAIGSFEDAASLGNLILNNRKKQGWFTSDGNAVTNFVLGLFCRSQSGEYSEFRANTHYEFYGALIDNLFEADGKAIERCVRDACDFHVEQSRNLTAREH